MERNSFLKKKTYWYEKNYGTPFQNAVFISPSKHVQKKKNKNWSNITRAHMHNKHPLVLFFLYFWRKSIKVDAVLHGQAWYLRNQVKPPSRMSTRF